MWLLFSKLTYLDPLLSILKKQNDSGDDAARGLLDLGRFGFVGHSRGAKLSTLHFTSESKTNLLKIKGLLTPYLMHVCS